MRKYFVSGIILVFIAGTGAGLYHGKINAQSLATCSQVLKNYGQIANISDPVILDKNGDQKVNILDCLTTPDPIDWPNPAQDIADLENLISVYNSQLLDPNVLNKPDIARQRKAALLELIPLDSDAAYNLFFKIEQLDSFSGTLRAEMEESFSETGTLNIIAHGDIFVTEEDVVKLPGEFSLSDGPASNSNLFQVQASSHWHVYTKNQNVPPASGGTVQVQGFSLNQLVVPHPQYVPNANGINIIKPPQLSKRPVLMYYFPGGTGTTGIESPGNAGLVNIFIQIQNILSDHGYSGTAPDGGFQVVNVLRSYPLSSTAPAQIYSEILAEFMLGNRMEEVLNWVDNDATNKEVILVGYSLGSTFAASVYNQGNYKSNSYVYLIGLAAPAENDDLIDRVCSPKIEYLFECENDQKTYYWEHLDDPVSSTMGGWVHAVVVPILLEWIITCWNLGYNTDDLADCPYTLPEWILEFYYHFNYSWDDPDFSPGTKNGISAMIYKNFPPSGFYLPVVLKKY